MSEIQENSGYNSFVNGGGTGAASKLRPQDSGIDSIVSRETGYNSVLDGQSVGTNSKLRDNNTGIS